MNEKIKIIELLNKIANGEIEDKQKFRVHFKNGLTRDIYYKKIYGKNISSLCNWYDNYTFQDEYDLDDEVEILEDNTKEIEELNNKLSIDWTDVGRAMGEICRDIGIGFKKAFENIKDKQ